MALSLHLEVTVTHSASPRPPWHLALVLLVVAAMPMLAVWWVRTQRTSESLASPPLIQQWFYAWWDRLPEQVQTAAPADTYSNIAPDDYVGPQTCGNCHKKNYRNWSRHPHRWMNAEATPETVKGRFDGSTLHLRGGTVTAYQKDGHYWMRLQRHGHLREFRITHTIGSRLQQYYVGVLERGEGFEHLQNAGEQVRRSGAAAGTKPFRPETRMVLPVGFRLTEDRWAPTYSVLADNDTDFTPDPYENFQPTAYYDACAKCHTTMPQGYRMILDNNAVGLGKPPLHFALGPFFRQTLAEMTDTRWTNLPHTSAELNELVRDVSTSYSPERAVTLGISCEACHYGGFEHAESGGKVPPRFFPSSPYLRPVGTHKRDYGRIRENVNLVCAQCHAASRLLLPGGAARVNSSEYRDAISGSCYSQLTCIRCHEPHTRIGRAWAKTPDEDDARCISCHKRYDAPEARAAHSHHTPGTPGARCMNCHMPKITEGLEDMVRTHQISSPTNRDVIHQGGTNACNLCHLDKPIDWTLDHLADWYGASFDAGRIASTYQNRDEPLGRTWLADPNSSIRMIAMGAVKRARANWLAPEVVEQLDDVHLINRQFAQNTLETVLGVDLNAAGYSYWMEPAERRAAWDNLRSVVAASASDTATSGGR